MTPASEGAVQRMSVYGGAFAQALAVAWFRADPENRARLEAAFADLFARYSSPPAEVRA